MAPLTSFLEDDTIDGKKVPVWFALEDPPLAFFAGTWMRWTNTRKKAEGEVTVDAYGFLTTDPNAEVGAVHPKSMSAILTTKKERDVWLRADWSEGDVSAYFSFDEQDRFIVAGRAAYGTVIGADLEDVPNSRRFYAGGGG